MMKDLNLSHLLNQEFRSVIAFSTGGNKKSLYILNKVDITGRVNSKYVVEYSNEKRQTVKFKSDNIAQAIQIFNTN